MFKLLKIIIALTLILEHIPSKAQKKFIYGLEFNGMYLPKVHGDYVIESKNYFGYGGSGVLGYKIIEDKLNAIFKVGYGIGRFAFTDTFRFDPYQSTTSNHNINDVFCPIWWSDIGAQYVINNNDKVRFYVGVGLAYIIISSPTSKSKIGFRSPAVITQVVSSSLNLFGESGIRILLGEYFLYSGLSFNAGTKPYITGADIFIIQSLIPGINIGLMY